MTQQIGSNLIKALMVTAGAIAVAVIVLLTARTSLGSGSPTPIAISNIPLTVAIPAHPQVVIAIGNSESMDGNLSGAIMTGSGSLSSSLSLLQNSSSPSNYIVPSGFTPPVTGGSVGSSVAYTATTSGNLVDNSPSRLNVAKAGLTAVLNTFLPNTDFALMDYQTSGLTKYTTWVYYMSQSGANFSFTNFPGASRSVINPCFGISLSGTDTVSTNCQTLNTFYGGGAPGITDKQYMLIGASSDDPSINDVLYASGLSGVCVVYGGPSPANPFPPHFTLSQYNSGSVVESYSSQKNTCTLATGPTNAGYVPYSQQVMYVERGFGYYTTGETATTGTVLVPMKSAGVVPTTASVNTALAFFTPYLAPETNNTGTTEIKASATQAPLAGLLAGAKSYYSNSNPPSSNGCAPNRYVVLMTDGLPTLDLAGKNWPPLGSAAAAGYGVTATFNADGSLATTNSQALTDTIASLTSLKSAGIKTYIIGLGAGVDPTKNPIAAQTLTAMAIAGGTVNYFAATDPTAVANDLQVILATIVAATQSTASAAVNSTSIHTGAVAYQAQFTTSDGNQDWTGNLSAFPIDPTTGAVNTNPSAAVWTAQSRLDLKSWDARIIATWDPVTGAGTPFRWNSSGSATSGIASTTTLGTQLMSNPADTSGQDALQYLRGRRSLEQANGGSYRTRAHVLGDIVDSSPVYIGAPNAPYLDSTYFAFEKAYASRSPVLYVGANDGMLHALNAATGDELFAYIPSGVYANLIRLTYPYYNEDHRFFVDGSPQGADVKFSDSTWHTIVVGGENAGGKSVYALDVTDPSSITSESSLASKVLWDFTDSDMGLSYSTPAIANTNSGFTVFFGNGYNSNSQTPFLYALNPQTGAVKAKLDLCAAQPTRCNSSVANGLSSVTVTNASGDLTGPATIVYAGDLQGNVWRIDVSSSSVSSWTISVLFQAKDSSNASQPITTGPAVTLNPRYPFLRGNMVFVGTGQMLGISDLSVTQVQTMYGLYDSGAGGSPITRSNLVPQVLSLTTVTTASGGTVTARQLTGNAVDLTSKKGWFVDFSSPALPGERIVTEPQIDSGAVLVTSNQPSSNTCTGGDVAWLDTFNFATGGKFVRPQLDINGDGAVNSSDAIVAGMSLGNVFAASPKVVSINYNPPPPTGGTAPKSNCSMTRSALVTKSDGSIQTVPKCGAGQQRTAWWEVR